jgi:hypothetical protein
MPPSNEDEIERITRSLTNQPPVNDEIVLAFEELRVDAIDYAQMIIMNVPPCRERSLALTKLEESVMWAVKGIILNQEAVLGNS